MEQVSSGAEMMIAIQLPSFTDHGEWRERGRDGVWVGVGEASTDVWTASSRPPSRFAGSMTFARGDGETPKMHRRYLTKDSSINGKKKRESTSTRDQK